MRREFLAGTLVAAVALLTSAAGTQAQQKSDADRMQASVNRALGYLETKGQSADGSYSKQPAVTALVTTAVLRHGRSANDPLVAKSLKYLEGFVREDGGVYSDESLYKNYETCLAILCFQAANKDGKYDKLLKKADAFVKQIQWDGSEGHDEANPAFGGAGYGKHKRPDLSNTNFLVEALKATGNGPDSEAMKKALIFISRCQNLESAKNTTPFPAKVNDGGFYYTPAAGGQSQAGTTENGGLRSYASMTYAGLKSMIFAGVKPDDPRVKAAFEWAQKNYDLSSNPGMGQMGLYYYYHTFAKALDAMGVEELKDEAGKVHRWRSELLAELAKRQKPDGSWTNDEPRWMEGDPNLVTGYALLALAYCKPPAK